MGIGHSQRQCSPLYQSEVPIHIGDLQGKIPHLIKYYLLFSTKVILLRIKYRNPVLHHHLLKSSNMIIISNVYFFMFDEFVFVPDPQDTL